MTLISINAPKAQTLVSQVSDKLRVELDGGKYAVGDRLPSEAALTQIHSVSRTVIREAIANLRSEGLVETRKGAGVFALDPLKRRQKHPFSDLDPERISGVIEMLEMRSAFEIRSAGLAAIRRSNAQLEAILKAHDDVGNCIKANISSHEADFLFHFSIAQATQNTRFPQFLMLIRDGIVPRSELSEKPGGLKVTRNPNLQEEHNAVVSAIMDGDGDVAENAMKLHLESSLRRYRDVLRNSLTS